MRCPTLIGTAGSARPRAWFNLGVLLANQQNGGLLNGWVFEMFVRAYLRASTSDQDANRARDQLKAFAAERCLKIASWYTENESGAKLARPELFQLLADSQAGDILLVEQVDRLSRLNEDDWERLKAELTSRWYVWWHWISPHRG
jgi:hypothetical protein